MNYSTTLEIERCLYSLTFSQVYTFDTYKLFVRAVNSQSEVAGFEIRKDGLNKWKVVLPAPEWAIKYQRDLIAIVERNH